MELILAILAAFVLACVAWPHLVRSRPHFVLAVAGVAGAMFCAALANLAAGPVFRFLQGLLEIAALLLMVMSGTGGRLVQWYQDARSSIRQI